MDGRTEFAAHLKNPPQGLLKGGEPRERFWCLGPMYYAICRDDFVKNIQIPFVQGFLEIPAHGGLVRYSGHGFLRIPSVSVDPHYLQQCLLMNQLLDHIVRAQ